MDSAVRIPGLTGNQLKLIALVAMTLDHMGLMLLPGVPILRILGRLAFPIFAYMIAEGCRYSRNRGKYLLSMACLALVCQIVYFFAMGSLYMSVLVSFTLAILTIYALDFARRKGGATLLMPLAALSAVIFLAKVLPHLLNGTDYAIDYGLWGILLPVLVYLGKTKGQKLLLCATALCLIALESGGIQWWSLAALPLLLAYSGHRGKRKMKYLFYIYYPLHLVVLQGLAML